jgi:hypothetical protein
MIRQDPSPASLQPFPTASSLTDIDHSPQNDLNMDHFTRNIIHTELVAVTSSPVPDINAWAFQPENDQCFDDYPVWRGTKGITPDEWLGRGLGKIQEELATTSML